MYHIFFIHSFVDGHFGCFHDLAIVSSAAMNTGVHVLMHICGIQKNGTDEPVCKAEIETQM